MIRFNTLITLTLLLLSCSSTEMSRTDGGGSEIAFIDITNNRISGVVSPGTRVQLFHVETVPDSETEPLQIVEADSNSEFEFQEENVGEYTLLFTDTSGSKGAFVDSIVTEKDTVIKMVLTPIISINGVVFTDSLKTSMYEYPEIAVYVQGTNFFTTTNSEGKFWLQLPEGKMNIHSRFLIDTNNIVSEDIMNASALKAISISEPNNSGAIGDAGPDITLYLQ